MKRVLVCGAGGFIGSHLVRRLKKEGAHLTGVDLKRPEFSTTAADEFILADLTDATEVARIFTRPFDEIYQLAANMGGAGFIFTGENDAEIMTNSTLINLNIARFVQRSGRGKIFFSSSACVYPEHNQLDPNNPICTEASAYPAAPDSEYGWEKLYSERLFLSYHRNHRMEVRIARFHNVFGEEGTWTGGREKAPAALCRKVAEAPNGGSIEIWGDGKQTRSFLYVEECVDGVLRLMRSSFTGPVNIGSEEMISINDLARLITDIAGKKLNIRNIKGPNGVRGRNSDNRLIQEKLGWKPSQSLKSGMEKTYRWISAQVEQQRQSARKAA